MEVTVIKEDISIPKYLPRDFKHLQFSVRLAFAMIINKASY